MGMNWLRNIFCKDLLEALKKAEEKILIQESRFRGLIENSLDGIVILSAAGKSLYISPSIERILGFTEDEAMQTDIFSLSHPDDLPKILKVLEELTAKADGSLHLFTGRMMHKNGEWRWLEAKVRNLLHDPSVNGIVVNFTDVTEKTLAREKLIQANRLYAFLSQINKTIVHASDEATVFKEACRIAIEIGGLSIAWVGSLDQETQRIRVVESYGVNPDEKALFEQIPNDVQEPQHQVLNGASCYVCNDLQQSDLTRWKPIAKVKGIRSIVIFPIKKSGRIYGTLNLYSSQIDFFNEQEIALLDEASNDISFALDVFEKDKRRLKAEKDLQHKELRYRQAQEIAHLGSWELDFATGKSIWSEEACRIYGVPVEENVQSHDIWLSFIHPDDLGEVLDIVKEATAALKPTEFDFRILRRNGEVRHLFQQSQYIFDEEGNPTGLYGAVHDVTEMRKAEEAVRASEKSLRDIVGFNAALIRVAPVGIASFNVPTGKCLSVNQAFADTVGAGPEELIGLNYREIASWAASGLLTDATLAVETGEVIQREIFFRSTFGNEKWINYRFVRFLNKSVPHLLLLMTDVTERKQAEEDLRKSESQFRNIVETAQEGIWLSDGNYKTLFINKRLRELLEYSPDEIIGRSLFEFMDKEGRKEASECMTLQEGNSGKLENIAFHTKSGKKIVTNLSYTHLFDEEGAFTGSLAMIADVTEKAKLEDLLDKTNRISSIGNFEIDLVSEKVYWSDIMREIMEVDSSFTPDLSTANTFYKEGEHNVLINKKVRELIEFGIPYDEELQILTRKGSVKWVRTIGEVEFLHGKCQRIYGSFQDIDDRKRSQLEILKVYEEKNDILESIADAFYAVDKKWVVTYWNKEAENLLQKDRADIIGKNLWEEYVHLVDSDIYQYYQRAVDRNQAQHFVMNYTPLKRWFDISVYPTSNGVSVYFKDVTEDKESEIRLQKLNRNLEDYTKELVVSNKNLEQFSYIVSHNLRTPVANILGLSNILKDESLPVEQKDLFTQELFSSVETLDEVIMDLNSILKKRQEINENKEEVSFLQVVNKVRQSISGLIQSEAVEINTDFSAVNEYYTIKSYFHSIFYNLIVNSIKYRSPVRRPIIGISSSKREGKIFLIFKDNGSGFDLEKTEGQIFGLYKRFHSHIEGKGMGLFMVKTQVEVLGGKIKVKSRPDFGTEFEIELPNDKPTTQHGTA